VADDDAVGRSLLRPVPGIGRIDRAAIVIAIGLVALVALPPFAQAIGQPFLVNLTTRIAIYAIAAVSLDLILGFGGMVSFGHAAWFGLGGYVVAVAAFHAGDGSTFLGLPGSELALVSWPAAIAVAALAALVVGALSLRTSGIHFIMITLAFAQMLYYVVVAIKAYGGDDGLAMARRSVLPGLDVRSPVSFYYLCLACLVAWTLLCNRVVHSRFGLVLQGIRQSERRMLALGYPVYRYKLIAFVIAACGAALAGVLWANSARFVSPDMLSWMKSGEFLVIVILGGSGTLYGPILGAAMLLGLEHALARYTEHWMLILGPTLVLFVLFARRGLYGVVAGERIR
jgi:branched-chain amino acid transport system permease protein